MIDFLKSRLSRGNGRPALPLIGPVAQGALGLPEARNAVCAARRECAAPHAKLFVPQLPS